MEITGKIILALPEVSGTSKAGNPWKKREYVLETLETYPKKVFFNFFGDRADQYPMNVGEEWTVSFDIESREFNGRWYTDIRAWKAERPAQAGAAPMQQPYNPGVPAGVAGQNPQMPGGYNFPPQVNQAAGEPTDDLPF